MDPAPNKKESLKEEEFHAEDDLAKDTTDEISPNNPVKRKRGANQKFKVKRRKLKEAGAPKMPLTGKIK